MSSTDEERRRAVALFRHGVIAVVLCEPLEHAGALIRLQSGKVWAIPGSRRTRVGETTIRDWIRRYEEQGFEGLLPKYRRDRAKPRRMPPEAIEVVLSIKGETPELSVRQVIKRARASGEIPADVPLPPSTLHRLFTREGLMVREQAGAAQDLRRFEFPFAGDCWQSDSMHGPAARDENGRMRKTYLLVTLDDATRVVPYASFGFSENAAAFMLVFREAVFRRGIPRRLYVDQGACFRSQQLALVCAKLGVALIHARAFHPAGKGKVERFLRSVRTGFLPLLTEEDLRSLETLNRRFWTWLDGEYHQRCCAQHLW